MLTRSQLLKHKPLLMAGPCAVESRTQIIGVAIALKKMGVHVLRGQLWKPRTSPGDFQGVGEEGIPWLLEAKKNTGLLISTEIVDKDQIELVKNVSDILWVGARNMQNFELLKALGKDKRPVILKRGLINTVKEWLGAADYIGRNKVILCERGIRTGADSMRFTLDLNAALVAKHDHGIPVIADPSHTAGRRDMVAHLAYACIAAGLDGIVVEVHPDPEHALSDKTQQVSPKVFLQMVAMVQKLHKLVQSK